MSYVEAGQTRNELGGARGELNDALAGCDDRAAGAIKGLMNGIGMQDDDAHEAKAGLEEALDGELKGAGFSEE